MHAFLTVIKKELRRFFTDKRMILTLLLPGVLLYVMYSFMGSAFEDSFNAEDGYEYQVYIVNNPSDESYNKYFNDIFEVSNLDVVTKDINVDELDEYKTKLTNKEIDLVVYYEEDFLAKVDAYDSLTSQTPPPMVRIYYNSVEVESQSIYQMYNSILNSYESNLNNKFDINLDNENYDLATKEEKSASFITQMLPMLLVLLLFSGCMGISTESIAGEKERGTIATLLVTPMKRTHLAYGKIIALSIVSLVGATSSYLGLMLSFPKLLGGTNSGITTNIYGFKEYIMIFLVMITLVLVFTVLLSILSTYAKSVKEAQQLAMPLMIIVMVCGVSTMFASKDTNIMLCFIPIYNSVVCLVSILGLKADMTLLLLTIVMNLVYVGIGAYILKCMFDSESVMFNK